MDSFLIFDLFKIAISEFRFPLSFFPEFSLPALKHLLVLILKISLPIFAIVGDVVIIVGIVREIKIVRFIKSVFTSGPLWFRRCFILLAHGEN